MTRRLAATALGAAGMIAVLTLASRLVGFLRWIVHSWMLHGESATAGAYAAANQIPNVLFEVAAGGALASVVVPLLAAPVAQAMRGDVSRIASALLSWTLVALVPLGALLALLAAPIASWLPTPASLTGESAQAYTALLTTLLRVFSAQLPLYGIGIVMTGVLHAHKRFFWPAVAPLLSSLVVIASYLWFGQLAAGHQDAPAELSGAAVAVLAWGTTAGVAAMSLVQVVPVLRLGVRLRPVLRFPEARRAAGLAGAGLGALLAQQVAVLAVVVMAPYGGRSGTLAVFQYAQSVYLLPYAVFAVPLATSLYPRLAEAATRGAAEVAQLTQRSTRMVLAVAIAGAAILYADAPTAPALFGVGPAMGRAIAYLAPGVVGMALIYHGSRVLYAVNRGRAAVTATSLGWLSVAALSVVLVPALAPGGGDDARTLIALGLANTLGMAVAFVALMLALRHVAATSTIWLTAAAAGAGGALGALAGRWVVEEILQAGSVTSSLLAAVPGAVLAAAPALAVAWLVNRRAVP